METITLGWGENVCSREVLNQLYKPKLDLHDIKNMEYAPDNGSPELIDLVQEYLQKTCGRTYKHIIITGGTTPSINVVLRALKSSDSKLNTVATHNHYFPYYPSIIKKNDMKHVASLNMQGPNHIKLIDMPSNPTGSMSQSSFCQNTVWDSVYFNPVFINSPRMTVKPHKVNVGSLSKSFGLTGLRIGYIATDSDLDYKRFSDENLYETCTVSVPSQELAIDIMSNIIYNTFFQLANRAINHNRESLNKINYLFDEQEVQNNGMFYAAYAEPKALEIIDKAMVNYVVLSDRGKNKFVRFNLGQNNELTAKAVSQILKVDGK